MIKSFLSILLKKLKQFYKLLLVAGIIFFVFIFFVLPRVKAYVEGPVAQYETTKVKKGDITQSISASGQIEAERQVDLKFQTSGQLVWVGVKEGDKVKKWQAIASLDKREIEINIKKKLLAYMNERWDFEQSSEDYGVEGIPIEAKGTLTEAERRILEKAQFDLDSTVLDVEIQDLAKKLATLISPIEGIVTHIDVPLAGVNITPATATFTIADPSEMKFVANVDESDIALVKIGQKVEISLDAFLEETFTGEVNKISFAAVTTRGGGTAFPVEILLPENLEERFRVGMNGDVEIIISQVDDVLKVPSSAIIETDGQTKIKTFEGKSIKEIEVKTGLESENETQILESLTEGQLIIIGEKKK
jgi:HlyD family secretion protein